jgi:uncharacterized protein YuzE
MELTYDSELDVAYIRFKTKWGRVKTVMMSDELNVDLAADGSVYGIELLNAKAQLGLNGKKTPQAKVRSKSVALQRR